MADTTIEIAQAWLTAFVDAAGDGDRCAMAHLFDERVHWRDMLLFTSTIGTVEGADEAASGVLAGGHATRILSARIAEGFTPPREVRRFATYEVLEFFAELETERGTGLAVVRLVRDDRSPVRHGAFTLLTALRELRGVERVTGRSGRRSAQEISDVSWSELRERALAYDDREPEALVIGAGHSGLFVAKYLQELGVDALIIEKNDKVGDNWRQRYRSLTLHNPTDIIHFPGMPFPDSFPEYLPKDKLADWMEFYARAMDFNVWTGTELLRATYDDTAGCWDAVVLTHGVERVLHPKHIVMATGGEGSTPVMPEFPGLENFAGRVTHSKYFTSGHDYVGERVLVVGSGTSGHDVALEVCNAGGEPTMLQRGDVVVVSLDSANSNFGQYFEDRSVAEADLIGSANFMPGLMWDALRAATDAAKERDRDLIEGVNAAGLRTSYGPDGTGFARKFYDQRGGYYFDVGASGAIAEGRISVLDNREVDSLVAAGLRTTGGSVIAFDAVILATGYEGPEAEMARLFGDDIAHRVGAVGGLDERGEIRSSFVPVAQRGLWFQHGSIHASRTHAYYVALQIKAAIDGVLPDGAIAEASSAETPELADSSR